MKRKILRVLAILMIGILVACSDDTGDNDKKETIVAVETTQAQQGKLVVEKTLYGRTAPNSITPIMLEMIGEVDTIEVENGDKVEKDAIIATVKTPVGKQNIKAPKAGEITGLKVKEGDIATDSDPFALIVDMEQMKVTYSVTNNLRTLLKKEMELKTTVDGHTYQAKISTIDAIPDETGLYPVEAIIENNDHDLIPGLIVKTFVPEKKIKKAIILPTEAIIEESDGAFIYIVADGKAVKTEVTVKETQSDVTAIEGEVNVDDEIVINGQLTLSDGSKVEVLKAGNES